MANQKKPDGEWSLEVSAAERTTWRVQRIGWGFMAVVAIAALLGGLGAGPIADREDGDATHSVRWSGISRLSASNQVQIRFQGAMDTGFVTLDRALLASHALERWNPEPLRTVATSRGVEAVFALDAADSAGIALTWTPQRVGRHTGTVTVNGTAHRLVTTVLP